TSTWPTGSTRTGSVRANGSGRISCAPSMATCGRPSTTASPPVRIRPPDCGWPARWGTTGSAAARCTRAGTGWARPPPPIRALAADPASGPARLRALYALNWILCVLGAADPAESWAREQAELAQRLGDPRGLAEADNARSLCLLVRADIAGATAVAQAAVAR